MKIKQTAHDEKMACLALKSVSDNNQQLTTQADKKAHILIQVNGLMVSVLLTFAVHLQNVHRMAFIPIAIQLLFSLTVIAISLRCTRPRIISHSHIDATSTNLLFFGEYDALEAGEYIKDMEQLIQDTDRLYSALTKDIYNQAVVLARKYRHLRLAYHVFMIGLGITVLASIAIALH